MNAPYGELETQLKQLFTDDSQPLPDAVAKLLGELEEDTLILCRNLFQEIKNYSSVRSAPPSRSAQSAEITKNIFAPDKHCRAIENVMMTSSYNFPSYSIPVQVFMGRYSMQQIEQVVAISLEVRLALCERYPHLSKQRIICEYVYPRIERHALGSATDPLRQLEPLPAPEMRIIGVQALPLAQLVAFLNDRLSKHTRVNISAKGVVMVDGVTLGGRLPKPLIGTLRAIPVGSIMTADEIGKRRVSSRSKQSVHQHIAAIRSFFTKRTTRHSSIAPIIQTVGREGYKLSDAVVLIFE